MSGHEPGGTADPLPDGPREPADCPECYGHGYDLCDNPCPECNPGGPPPLPIRPTGQSVLAGCLAELRRIGRICRAAGIETIAFTRPAAVARLVAERNRLAVLLYREARDRDPSLAGRIAGDVEQRLYTGKFPLSHDEVAFLKALFGPACEPEKFEDA